MSEEHSQIIIRTTDKVAEVSYFCELCGGDTTFLGWLDPERRSSYENCKNILLTAEEQGFNNILLPSSYIIGQDPFVFAGAIAPQTKKMNLLVAMRCGEYHPPMMARAIASLDHILEGRLTVNIINSDLPGWKEDGEYRYKRCDETIQILKQAWNNDTIDIDGEVYKMKIPSGPSKPYQQNGGPLLYFGGTSESAREVCAKHCDVFLTWPEPEASIIATMKDLSQRAEKYNRKIDFGLRVHVIVRETEAEARAYAKHIMSKFNEKEGLELKHRSLDSNSLGVLRQDEFRKQADSDGYIEPLLWGEIGKARSGCGAAIVGSAEQVIEKLNRYIDIGIRSFVLSGYPLKEEAEIFGRLVLPHLPNVKLSELQGRTPKEKPVTPLTTGALK
ncbi:MAG: LLM class flavin-dependent oxidoreductase [Cytophagales bacterium]|nr:MAG: LLM class flavin-dependent oxidoreductase [Cytophagales bacterium]